jgi:hypothetical protein
MTAQKTLKSSVHLSKSWCPDPASLHDNVWFDDLSKYLYIDFRKLFATCLRITAWNKGLSVDRWNEVLQNWQTEEWDPGIPVPFLPYVQDFPLEQFFSEIPKEVIRAISPFKWRQFVLLRMLRHCPETLELLQSNPALAWFCADAIAKSEVPAHKAREIIMSKRRDICAFAGLPATEAMVKTLSRIKSKEYTQKIFDDLRKIFLQNEKMLKLRSIPYIPGEEIHNLLNHFDYTYWLLSTRDYTGMTIWENLTMDNEKEVYHLWTDSKKYAKSLQIARPENHLRKCKSIGDLRDLHNMWLNMYNKINLTKRIVQFFIGYGTYSFPPPPLPGDADIVPITTIKDLQDEGAIMHNCVGSYTEKIQTGECFIYRVLRPQRATLEISDTGDMHHICQLKLAHNGEPAAETWTKVRYWFASAIQVSYAAESLFISHTSSSMCLPRLSFP